MLALSPDEVAPERVSALVPALEPDPDGFQRNPEREQDGADQRLRREPHQDSARCEQRDRRGAPQALVADPRVLSR